MQRQRLTQDERDRRCLQALDRAKESHSLSNVPTIYAAFAARGIPEADIRPRENVFTFNAWKALGRFVRKGEKGVAVSTWVDTPATASEPARKFARRSYVFHVSQTEPAAK